MTGKLSARDLLTIGDVARRTGAAVSAIRFYEEKGLIEPVRTRGNQRRFLRSDIRRLSFILIAQRLGLSLEEIALIMKGLPHGRTPTARDWRRISTTIRARVEDQIAELERTRDRLDGCIGCGCLSLDKCAIYNPDDRLGESGPGPRQIVAPKA
ncbi:redox-sensitive transcriptional activator SoxR [Erythrobacter sp.]|jgi:MerR family redox-sensitive transcriptional activator SoxR|uniref:redox-sensitive transcriptional activator SoxR n=1 Tax=Erythrobacter sp. TaxID=1042 RepID=UPI002EA5B4D7|nr:redox-sensitive transcriptional activator SoxR [Erythrobacter sp.]